MIFHWIKSPLNQYLSLSHHISPPTFSPPRLLARPPFRRFRYLVWRWGIIHPRIVGLYCEACHAGDFRLYCAEIQAPKGSATVISTREQKQLQYITMRTICIMYIWYVYIYIYISTFTTVNMMQLILCKCWFQDAAKSCQQEIQDPTCRTKTVPINDFSPQM